MRLFADTLMRLLAAATLTAAATGGRAAEPADAPRQPTPAWADLSDAYDADAGSGGEPVENLTLPIEHYESGRVRAVLRAAQATVARDGFVRATQVRIELFDEAGNPKGLIVAENTLFHREDRRGYCRGAVSLTRQEVEVSGRDLYWSVPQRRIVVIANGRVIVKEWTRKPGEML